MPWRHRHRRWTGWRRLQLQQQQQQQQQQQLLLLLVRYWEDPHGFVCHQPSQAIPVQASTTIPLQVGSRAWHPVLSAWLRRRFRANPWPLWLLLRQYRHQQQHRPKTTARRPHPASSRPVEHPCPSAWPGHPVRETTGRLGRLLLLPVCRSRQDQRAWSGPCPRRRWHPRHCFQNLLRLLLRLPHRRHSRCCA